MAKGWLLEPNGNQSYSNAHKTARLINEKIIKQHCCSICSSEKNIDVHHINWNWNDNSLDNLQVLCRSCHNKIHQPKSICWVCGEPMKGLGYCDKHYQRYKKGSCPLYIANKAKCKTCARTKNDQNLCIEQYQEDTTYSDKGKD